MPFVKQTDTKGFQPLTDARKIFIGRTNELHFFDKDILEPGDPAYNIVSISGQGGVGKSTLLLRYIDSASGSNYKDYCLTAIVNERQATPASVMEKFAEQLDMTGDFEKALKQYKEVLHKLQTEREASRELLLRKTTTDLAGSVVKDVPFIGGILKEGVGAATSYFFDELHYRQLLKDAERLEDPIGDLTRAFVLEINRLTETQVTISPTRSKRHQRVILFFDTFEQLATEVAPWLLDHFLEANISNNVILVIAGRDPIEHSIPDYPKRWLPYYDSGILCSNSLNSFTEEETRIYLAERAITDSDRIRTIWQLSRGLPLYLSLLTSNPLGKVDPTADVVANFLRWIPEDDQAKRRLALDAALLSRPFNQDDLAAFTYLAEYERPGLYRWLTSQPFVRSNPQDGRYSYHDLAQKLFARHLYSRSQEEYYATRRSLAEYYRLLLEKTRIEIGGEVYQSAEWLELVLALVQQLFLLSDEVSHISAVEQILDTYEHTEQTGEISRVLRDLSQEQPNSQVTSSARQIAQQLLRYIEADPASKQELLLATSELLHKVSQKPGFSLKLLASIYIRRGVAYFLNTEYWSAIGDFERAITLVPKFIWAYGLRGVAYYLLNEYQRAIADFDYAIKLAPRFVWAYAKRGIAYRQLKEYDRAFEDFDRALTLNPNYAHVYIERGIAYKEIKEYQQAIIDFDHALTLDPKLDQAYIIRREMYRLLEDPQQIIQDLDTVLALNPIAWAYICRGETYLKIKEYGQAIEDFNRALTLESKSAAAYYNRGVAYRNLKEYEYAIKDFDRALELDPNYAWAYASRGETRRLFKEYQQAITDFDRAIALDSKYAWAYAGRGIAYTYLKNFEQAMEDFDRAFALDPNFAWAYANLGITRLWMRDISLAQADFAKASQLDPTDILAWWMSEWCVMCEKKADSEMVNRLEAIAAIDPHHYTAFVCRGVAVWLLEYSEKALAMLDQAILLAPDAWDAYFWKAIVLASIEQGEEAMTLVEETLENNLPPALLAPLRWFERDKPDFYQKHVVPLLARYELISTGVNTARD